MTVEQILVVANTTEFNYRHFLSKSGKIEKQFEISATNSFAFENAIFWGSESPRKLVIAPEPINEHLLAYVREVLRLEVSCFVPTGTGPAVSLRSARNRQFVKNVIRTGENRPIRVVCWGPTTGLDALIEVLKEMHSDQVRSEFSAEIGSALANHLNNKIENKTVLARAFGPEPSPIVIPSYIGLLGTPDPGVVSRYIQHFGGKAVIKPVNGWGGKANLSVDMPASAALSTSRIKKIVQAHVARHPGQFRGGIVIEKRIAGHTVKDLSIDVYIDKNKRVSTWPSLTIVEGLSCIGEETGKDVLRCPLSQALRSAGLKVADVLASIGYEGWFDVDFIEADNQLYALEINARRTGGTVPVEVATSLYGRDWMKRCAIRSHDVFFVNERSSARDIVSYFFEISSRSQFQTIALPVALRRLSSKAKGHRAISYLVCAESREECVRVDRQIRMKLGAP